MSFSLVSQFLELTSSVYFFKYVYMCVLMHVYECTWRPEDSLECHRQAPSTSSLISEVNGWPLSPMDPPSCASECRDDKPVPPCLAFLRGFWALNICPHAFVSSTLPLTGLPFLNPQMSFKSYMKHQTLCGGKFYPLAQYETMSKTL